MNPSEKEELIRFLIGFWLSAGFAAVFTPSSSPSLSAMVITWHREREYSSGAVKIFFTLIQFSSFFITAVKGESVGYSGNFEIS